MKFLLDMNLSPVWVGILQGSGYEAIHWSSIGKPIDKDEIIFDWAQINGYTIITLDMDFGTLLARTGSKTPSVIQIRREDVGPDRLRAVLLDVFDRFAKPIEDGVLIVLDEQKIRLRMLPI